MNSPVCPSRATQKRYWRINQKIGYGYFLAIAIGAFGSLMGIVIADYYQGQGVKQLQDAHIQAYLLSRYQDAALTIQLQGFQVHTILADSPPVSVSVSRLETSLKNAQRLQTEIEDYINSRPAWLAVDQKVLRELLQSYTGVLTDYTQFLITHSQDFDAPGKGEFLRQLENQRQQLDAVLTIAYDQELRGGDMMEEAQGLEKLIIIISLALSVAIASAFALRTTKTISKPLEAITQVAKTSALESNFHLRVPIDSNDEIGLLAKSLNLLIERVSDRTQELEKAAMQAELHAQQLQSTLYELQTTQAQLIQTEKLSALGQMLAGIAHEINNPVSFIYGNINYAQQHFQELLELVNLYHNQFPQRSPEIQELEEEIDLEFLKSDLHKLLNSMKMGTERIRSIVLSLRIFSRLDELEYKPLDVHEGIESTLLILGNRFKNFPGKSGLKVIKDFQKIPSVECYGGQLNQVFMNILTNAIDALEEAITKNPEFLEPTIKISTYLLNSHQVQIRIADNGLGIPPEVQAKLFDPFFTTKPSGKGTGLGMSISYKIITEKHHGQLKCVSSPGQGAEFIVTIPIQQVKSIAGISQTVTKENERR